MFTRRGVQCNGGESGCWRHRERTFVQDVQEILLQQWTAEMAHSLVGFSMLLSSLRSIAARWSSARRTEATSLPPLDMVNAETCPSWRFSYNPGRIIQLSTLLEFDCISHSVAACAGWCKEGLLPRHVTRQTCYPEDLFTPTLSSAFVFWLCLAH